MKIGLALSGGGARGIAHLGVLKALEELNIKLSMISGCSAGGVVGAMYAAGNPPEKILEFLKSKRFINYFRPAFNKGFIKIDNLEKLYKTYFPENTFESLKIPVVLNATDLNRGKTVYFSKGELIKPLLASCCIPVMFKPFVFEGNSYVDGGILNNLPVEPLLGHCDFIIGVHTNAYNENSSLKTIRLVMERSLLLAIHTNVKERIQFCDVYIEPPLYHFTTLDIDKAQEIFNIGYEHTLSLEDTFKSKGIKAASGEQIDKLT